MRTVGARPSKSEKERKLDQMIEDPDSYYADAWDRAMKDARQERE